MITFGVAYVMGMIERCMINVWEENDDGMVRLYYVEKCSFLERVIR